MGDSCRGLGLRGWVSVTPVDIFLSLGELKNTMREWFPGGAEEATRQWRRTYICVPQGPSCFLLPGLPPLLSLYLCCPSRWCTCHPLRLSRWPPGLHCSAPSGHHGLLPLERHLGAMRRAAGISMKYSRKYFFFFIRSPWSLDLCNESRKWWQENKYNSKKLMLTFKIVWFLRTDHRCVWTPCYNKMHFCRDNHPTTRVILSRFPNKTDPGDSCLILDEVNYQSHIKNVPK